MGRRLPPGLRRHAPPGDDGQRPLPAGRGQRLHPGRVGRAARPAGRNGGSDADLPRAQARRRLRYQLATGRARRRALRPRPLAAGGRRRRRRGGDAALRHSRLQQHCRRLQQPATRPRVQRRLDAAQQRQPRLGRRLPRGHPRPLLAGDGRCPARPHGGQAAQHPAPTIGPRECGPGRDGRNPLRPGGADRAGGLRPALATGEHRGRGVWRRALAARRRRGHDRAAQAPTGVHCRAVRHERQPRSPRPGRRAAGRAGLGALRLLRLAPQPQPGGGLPAPLSELDSDLRRGGHQVAHHPAPGHRVGQRAVGQRRLGAVRRDVRQGLRPGRRRLRRVRRLRGLSDLQRAGQRPR